MTTQTLSPTESVVMSVWNEVLQPPEPLDLDSNFFNLGGDSLAMMMVLFRIGAELGVEPPPFALLEAATPRTLAALLEIHRQSQSVGMEEV